MPRILLSALMVVMSAGAVVAQDRSAGEAPGRIDGGALVATGQRVRPAGQTLEVPGRPVDLVLSPDGSRLFAKDDHGLVVADTAAWKVLQRLNIQNAGGSMHGLAVSADGAKVYVTDSKVGVHEAGVQRDGTWKWLRRIDLAGPEGKGVSYPCGVALTPDGARALVCLSRNNALGVVDLASGKIVSQIEVGVAPYDVTLAADGRTAYVSNYGGRRPREGERSMLSSKTPALVDARDVAATGTVSVVDVEAGKVVAEIEVGLHPCGQALSADGALLYVACSASDRVAVVDTASRSLKAKIDVRPDAGLPFGSSPQAVAVAPDGKTMFVTNAGNNAVAVVDLSAGLEKAAIKGLIPTAWYPGGLAVRDGALYTANTKGLGSRSPRPKEKGWHVFWALGTLGKVTVPDGPGLEVMTRQAREDAMLPQALRAQERTAAGVAAVPVPALPGQPSVFEHVVYVIKENRTYDQVLGDIGKGNSDPSLCIYGRAVTPNIHALAEQYVLLDNFYCNGVCSADGHAWATEGAVAAYVERAFGGFSRSYDYGKDPLGISASGAIWDHAIAAGLSLRNYGEIDFPRAGPGSTFAGWLEDLKAGANRLTFTQNIPEEHLRAYSCPVYPGWELGIPDVVRADRFLRELKEFEAKGSFPNLTIVYLPNDHTAGTNPGGPTPRAMVADNDLALGRIVEGLTRSKFWPKTAIFVIEDDPQDGFDHVDGHRSTCLVISPYTKRGEVVSAFYNQASVLHTIERILGMAAANQMYALAPVMAGVFADKADLTPYSALDNQVPLTEVNPPKASLRGDALRFAEASEGLPLSEPDRADEETLNRILWFAARGAEPYPAERAGAHGRGLAAMGLKLSDEDPDDDDDEPVPRPAR